MRPAKTIQSKRKYAMLHGKTDFLYIADMASVMSSNGSVECLLPPLRRGLCNYLLHDAGSPRAFQGCEPLRIPTAMGGFDKTAYYSRKAGSGQRAEATCAFDIIGGMVATEERRAYPKECDVLTDCLTATIVAA